MLTKLTRFCEIWRARGSISEARKISNQAAVVATTSAASRMKVRHSSERGHNLTCKAVISDLGEQRGDVSPRSLGPSLLPAVGHEDVAEPPHRLDIGGI